MSVRRTIRAVAAIMKAQRNLDDVVPDAETSAGDDQRDRVLAFRWTRRHQVVAGDVEKLAERDDVIAARLEASR